MFLELRWAQISDAEWSLRVLWTDSPPLKWSSLSYGFALKEDRDAKEDLQAGRE
jgi:hypothetical protein